MPRKANGRADKHRDDDYRMPGEAPAAESVANGQPAANGMPMAGMTGAPASGGADMSGGQPSGAGMTGGGQPAGDGMSGGGQPGGAGMSGGGQAGGAGMSGADGRTEYPTQRQCGVMDVHRRLLSTSPEYAANRVGARDRDDRTTSPASNVSAGSRASRVVVHVVWNTNAQNISQAQIDSQIDVLNRDFRATNPDIGHRAGGVQRPDRGLPDRVLPGHRGPERQPDHGCHPDPDQYGDASAPTTR